MTTDPPRKPTREELRAAIRAKRPSLADVAEAMIAAELRRREACAPTKPAPNGQRDFFE